MADKYVVTDVYRKPMTGAISKTAAKQYQRQLRAQGGQARIEKLGSDGKMQNPARKTVSLKSFTGTITRNANGTVIIKGRGKVAGKKR
jgi:hypothetical protein